MSESRIESRLPFPAAYLAHGVIGREFRAQMPAMLALVLIVGVASGLMVYNAMARQVPLPGDSYQDVFRMLAVFATLICGIICGAQEEEDGTADFPRRLPVGRVRVLFEKVMGAVLAFAAWAILSIIVMTVISGYGPEKATFGALLEKVPDASRDRSMVVILFSTGVLCGFLARKAVLAALLAGILSAATAFGIGLIYDQMSLNFNAQPMTVYVISAFYLALAAVFFVRREGR